MLSGIDIDFEKIYSAIPDEIKSGVPSAPAQTARENGLAFDVIINKILELFGISLKDNAAFFASLLAFLIIVSIFTAVKGGLEKSGFDKAFGFVSSVVLCTMAYSFVLNGLALAEEYTERLSNFITALLPALGTLYAASGNPAAAIGQNVSLLVGINALAGISADVVIPLLKIIFALTAAAAVSGVNLSGVCGIIKSAATTVCVGAFTILGAVLFFTTVLSASADTLAMRTVKFAAGSFIPIIGSLVGEASRSVISSIALIKNSVGVFAVVVVLYIALTPIIALSVKKLAVVLGSAVAKLLSCDGEAKFLDGVVSLFNLMLALMISSAVYFILALAIFVKTAV